MQSHLEAALLGHASNLYASTTNSLDDDEQTFHEDDGEEVEEYVDEDVEGENVSRGTVKIATGSSTTPRTVTLQMLLAADILQPGKGTMSIEYLGQKFVGDLLPDGKIQSQETDIVFASPSAWAIACKRFINPDKKSGCGWASVKYRGKKLDVYKNIWYRKQLQQQQRSVDRDNDVTMQKHNVYNMQYHRVVVKHNTIANRTLTHDTNTLIECVPFSNLGKIQPFLVSLSTNAALLMDFHCHLTKTEVSGYLAGHWDVNTHTLQITNAFPCRCTKSERDNALHVESEISKAIDKEKTILVGWYHSHPFAAATPTLRDIDAQLDYQIKMKGTSDNNYTPCIGIIIAPYNYENTSLESSIIAYWVIPPPETKPNEYGRPMLMAYSVVQDSTLTPLIKTEMTKCIDYYKTESDFIDFQSRYITGNFYIDKLKNSLISKFPREENESALWKFICDALGYQVEDKDCLLSIPSISTKSQLLSNLNTNFMPSSDISNLLFNSGKFPTTSSLLGLPDPMAHSTLAANNMFLSTNLFKMQELLKPLSTSSPIPTSKSKNSSLKIPVDIKAKSDFAAELLNLKNKLDFLAPDLNFVKPEFALSDFSISKQLDSVKTEGGSLNQSDEKPLNLTGD